MSARGLLLLILILANGVVLAVNLGWSPGKSEGEASRLTAQLHPESLQLLSQAEVEAVPASAPSTLDMPAAGAQPEAADTGDASKSAPEASPAAAQVPAPVAANKSAGVPAAPACLVVSSLNPNQAAVLQDEVKGWGRGWSVKDVSASGPSSGWWVHLPPQGGKDGAEQRIAQLRLQGVDDLFMVQDPGPNQYAISLGLYKREAAARELADALRSKGVKGVLVMPRHNVLQLQIRGPADKLPDAVARLVNKYRGATRHACALAEVQR